MTLDKLLVWTVAFDSNMTAVGNEIFQSPNKNWVLNNIRIPVLGAKKIHQTSNVSLTITVGFRSNPLSSEYFTTLCDSKYRMCLILHDFYTQHNDGQRYLPGIWCRVARGFCAGAPHGLHIARTVILFNDSLESLLVLCHRLAFDEQQFANGTGLSHCRRGKWFRDVDFAH